MVSLVKYVLMYVCPALCHGHEDFAMSKRVGGGLVGGVDIHACAPCTVPPAVVKQPHTCASFTSRSDPCVLYMIPKDGATMGRHHIYARERTTHSRLDMRSD